MKYWIFASISFFLLTSNCQSIKNLNAIPESDRLLSYKRTPCFGWCPTYEVTVLKDGTSYFSGLAYVPYLDTVQFDLSPEAFRKINAILRHPDYLNLTLDEPEEYVTDIPGLNFQDYKNHRQYELDVIIPDAIKLIVERIDRDLEKHKLIYHKEHYPMIRQEILIELKPNKNPYSLDGPDTYYQLSYQDHVWAHIHKYELFCAQDKVSRALEAIKERSGVREAQINHILERR